MTPKRRTKVHMAEGQSPPVVPLLPAVLAGHRHKSKSRMSAGETLTLVTEPPQYLGTVGSKAVAAHGRLRSTTSAPAEKGRG